MAFWDGYRWIRPSREAPQERRHRVRDILLTLPLIALLPAVLAIALLAQAAGPYLTGPRTVAPDSKFTVVGHHFPRNIRVQLTWDGNKTGMPLLRTDEDGSFRARVSVPDSARLGVHTVAARWLKGRATPTHRPRQDERRSPTGSPKISTVTLATLAVTVSTAAGATPPPRTAATATPTSTPTSTPSSTPTATPTSAPTASPRTTPAPTPGSTPTPPAGSSISHVVIVWLENHEASSVTSSSMPYLAGLAAQYGLAANYTAVTHPSLPNYLAMWSGSTQGVTDDGTYNLGAQNLSSQMTAAGLSWRAFQQNYPATSGCHTASSYSGGIDGAGVAGTYARKHDPPMSFTSVTGSVTECGKILPLAAYSGAANLIFVTPNLCNDAHDCSLGQADTFLKGFLPKVFADSNWSHTLLVVSFDEGSTSTGGGGRVYTMVARQGLSHFTSATAHNHYGMTRTIENIFGLGCLANSCNASPLSEFLP